MSSNDIPLSPFAGEAPGLLFGLPMPMSRAMALRGERIGNDRAQVRMGFQAEQSNSRGDVHGGAIASLLDCTLAGAARAHDPAAYGVVTIDLTLHFVSAASGDLIATAHCERRGRSISFVRGEVRASRLKPWNTKPKNCRRRRARSSRESDSTCTPLNRYSPAVGRSRHPRVFMAVDLPEPLGPMMATKSPWAMSRSTPLSA